MIYFLGTCKLSINIYVVGGFILHNINFDVTNLRVLVCGYSKYVGAKKYVDARYI